MDKATKKPGVIESLLNASPVDLSEIDSAISRYQQQVVSLQGHIARLQNAREVIKVMLPTTTLRADANGHATTNSKKQIDRLRRIKIAKKSAESRIKQGTPGPVGRGICGNTRRYRKVAAVYLHKNGCTRLSYLAKNNGIPLGSISTTLNHHWFKRTAKGITLSASGVRAALTLVNEDPTANAGVDQ